MWILVCNVVYVLWKCSGWGEKVKGKKRRDHAGLRQMSLHRRKPSSFAQALSSICYVDPQRTWCPGLLLGLHWRSGWGNSVPRRHLVVGRALDCNSLVAPTSRRLYRRWGQRPRSRWGWDHIGVGITLGLRSRWGWDHIGVGITLGLRPRWLRSCWMLGLRSL